MEEVKYSTELGNMPPRIILNEYLPQVSNILDSCETDYEPSIGILPFYYKFRRVVQQNLKKVGYTFGNEQLLQDEILSPTFEEVIMLWCLDKIQPNLSKKIKPEFNDRINSGISLIDIKDEIFQLLSNKNLDKSETTCLNCLNCKCTNNKDTTTNGDRVAKPDPECKNIEEILALKPEISDLLCGDSGITIKEETEHDFTGWQDEDLSMDNILSEITKKDKEFMEFSDGENFDNDDNGDEDFYLSDDNDSGVKKRRGRPKLSKNNPPIKCEKCGKTCAGEKKLKEHIERKHNNRFPCKQCDEVFDTLDDLKEHRIDNHKNVNQGGGGKKSRSKPLENINKYNAPVACDICGRTCAGERRLQEHIIRKHKTSRKCKDCDGVFGSADELKSHRAQVHKNDSNEVKREVCPYCGKMINSYFKKRHLLTHTSNIVCTICREKFQTQDELDVHTKRHEEDPNYRTSRKKTIKCETCHRGFSNIQDYGVHICKHYDCELCEARFRIRRNMIVHKKFHEGEQIFSCDLCEALFLKRKALYCHKRATHDPDAKKYKCDECGKPFLNRRELEAHVVVHSSEKTFKCDECPKSFKQKSGLRIHKKSHAGLISLIPCVSCDLSFKDIVKMKQHRESGECTMKKENVLPPKIES